MRKVLLIGASGFLGSFLKDHLEQAKYEVRTVSRSGDHVTYQVDISQEAAWEKIDFEPEIIINCATILPGGAIDDLEYARAVFNTNVLGSYHLCRWAQKRISVNYILNISTLAIVDKPWPIPLTEEEKTYPSGKHILYSLSKLNQEVILNDFPFKKEIKICHARLSSLFGEKMPWTGVMCMLIQKIINREPIEINNGSKTSADFLYVRNACACLLQLIEKKATGIINIASGEEIFLKQLVEKIALATGIEALVTYKETGEEENRSVVGVRKLRSVTGGDVQDTSFNDALQATIGYYQSLT